MRTTFFLLASGLLASVAVAAPLTTMPNATAAKLPAESELPNTEDVDDTATKETAKTTSVSPDLLRQAPGEARHKRHARDVRPRTDVATITAMVEDLAGENSAYLDVILALLEGLSVTEVAGAKRENKEPAHGVVPRDTTTETVTEVTDTVVGVVEDVLTITSKRDSSSSSSSSSSSKGPSSLLEGVSKSGVIDDSFAGAVGVANSVGGTATVLGTTVVNKRDGENVPREAAPLVIGAICKRDGENVRREAATVEADVSTCA